MALIYEPYVRQKTENDHFHAMLSIYQSTQAYESLKSHVRSAIVQPHILYRLKQISLNKIKMPVFLWKLFAPVFS